MIKNRGILQQINRFLLLLAAVITVAKPISTFAHESGTYDVLLFGSDRRDSSWNGNSDSMILVTINSGTETVYLTSFMRDMYADVPGYGPNKLNFAYAVGGAAKLEETLTANYGVQIDNYIAVDFVAMANLVDYLGGVDVYIKAAEIEELNKLASWMHKKYGISAGEPITGEGTWHLNGAQTVSFSRIRKVGNGDYERTERQRRVLQSIWKATKNYSEAEAIGLIGQLLTMINSDLSLTDAGKLAAEIIRSKNWEVVESRLPYDGMYYTRNEMLVPSDLGATREKLCALIYEGRDKGVMPTEPGVSMIESVQRAMNEIGYDCGKVDGLMGPLTEAAIRKYQEEHNLKATGEIDSFLLASLGIK